MTKENLIELKTLISRFNKENESYDCVYRITNERQYSKGCYVLNLEFDNLMYSLDVAELMRFCYDNDILVCINHCDICTWFHFQ